MCDVESIVESDVDWIIAPATWSGRSRVMGNVGPMGLMNLIDFEFCVTPGLECLVPRSPDHAVEVKVVLNEIVHQSSMVSGNGPSSGISSTGWISPRPNMIAHIRFTMARENGRFCGFDDPVCQSVTQILLRRIQFSRNGTAAAIAARSS